MYSRRLELFLSLAWLGPVKSYYEDRSLFDIPSCGSVAPNIPKSSSSRTSILEIPNRCQWSRRPSIFFWFLKQFLCIVVSCVPWKKACASARSCDSVCSHWSVHVYKITWLTVESSARDRLNRKCSMPSLQKQEKNGKTDASNWIKLDELWMNTKLIKLDELWMKLTTWCQYAA